MKIVKCYPYNITLPEMNHNEIVGWQGEQIDNFKVHFLCFGLTLDMKKISKE
ncbi:MAG: hypothetical protein Ct9H90mP15_06830 [Candidatus Neomarinimicrobiota bacterium]|nr:MAG: hypothetical protein Ct9H90mP15_06830 [Candidatus Neomarinimicrobiota bacterium]